MEVDRLRDERDVCFEDYIRAHHAGAPLRSELRLMTAARDEACELAESMLNRLDRSMDVRAERIAELRKVGTTEGGCE